MNLKRFNNEEQDTDTRIEAPVPNGIVGIDTTDGDTYIYLSGKIDANNFEEIQKAAFEQIDCEKASSLVFDMNAVNYVSSAGLRMFSAVNQKALENSVVYKLVKMKESINKLFQLTGYASAFCIEVEEEFENFTKPKSYKNL